MLSLFRSCYPKGSLIGELLAIEHGQYIVKVFVQVEGITLATGLAASSILEKAEDTARMRALEALNLDATQIVSTPETGVDNKFKKETLHSREHSVEQPQISIQPTTEPVQSPNLVESIIECGTSSVPQPDLSVQPQSSFNGNPKAASSKSASVNGGVAASSEVLTQPDWGPELVPDSAPSLSSDEIIGPKNATEQPLDLSLISESSDNESLPLSIPNVPETPKPPKASKTQKATQAKKPEAVPVVEPTPEEKLPEPLELSEETTAVQSTFEPEVTKPSGGQPLPQEESADSTLPIDSSAEILYSSQPSEKLVTEMSEPLPTPEQLDFSEIIARSNAQLKRLGWTNEEGRDYLLKTYGKKSRQLLNDQELLQFLHYLESLPTP